MLLGSLLHLWPGLILVPVLLVLLELLVPEVLVERLFFVLFFLLTLVLGLVPVFPPGCFCGGFVVILCGVVRSGAEHCLCCLLLIGGDQW